MSLSTKYLARCIQKLESSPLHLSQVPDDSLDYEIFRNAVKGFKLTLEMAGRLLRKAINSYTGNPRAVDELTCKDVLRPAAKQALFHAAAVEHWFACRDNRNNTARDYGEGFAEEPLGLMPGFITDVRRLRDALAESNLPILVEVFDRARIPDDIRREIQGQPVVALTCPMGKK